MTMLVSFGVQVVTAARTAAVRLFFITALVVDALIVVRTIEDVRFDNSF